MVRIVPLHEVRITPGYEPSNQQVKKCIPVLKAQGLIEPLDIDKNGEIGRRNIWDPARLEAARRLGWTNVIVTR